MLNKIISTRNSIVRKHKVGGKHLQIFLLVSRYSQFETIIYPKTKSSESFYVVIESGPCLAMEGRRAGGRHLGPWVAAVGEPRHLRPCPHPAPCRTAKKIRDTERPNQMQNNWSSPGDAVQSLPRPLEGRRSCSNKLNCLQTWIGFSRMCLGLEFNYIEEITGFHSP